MATYTDDFNRADGILTAPWANVAGGGFEISTNEAIPEQLTAGLQLSGLTGLTFTDDQDATVTITATGADFGGPAARVDGSGNGYAASIQPGDARLYLFRVDAGVKTSLGFASVTVPTPPFTLGITCTGTTIAALLNGVEEHTAVDATYTTGAVGLYAERGGSPMRFDDFTTDAHVPAGATVTVNETDVAFGGTITFSSSFSAISACELEDSLGNLMPLVNIQRLSANNFSAAVPGMSHAQQAITLENDVIFRAHEGTGVYSDADYPLTPDYDETGAVFFDSAASGANDGSSWTDAYNDEETALNALCASAAGTMLTCRGTFNTGSVISLSGDGGLGNSGAWYVFRADPVSGCDIISTNVTGEGGIEFGGQAYWIIDGFNITGGGRIFSYFPGGTSTGGMDHIVCRNITGSMSVGGDNVGWLHMDTVGADYVGAFNCPVQGPANTGFSTNTAVIFLSRTVHWRIQNCEMSRSLTGFYYKHFNESAHIADQGFFIDNYVHDCGFLAVHSASKDCLYKNSILDGNVLIADDGGGDNGADANIFDHVTITGYLELSNLDNLAQDNNTVNSIIQGQYLVAPYQTGTASTNTSDYNLYNDSAAAIRHQNTTYTLTTWQAGSVPASQDANSLDGDPTFVGGASPSTISGFALDTGSPGEGAASSGADMGADVTQVGA